MYKLLSPLLFKIEPETAHNMTLKAMQRGLVPTVPQLQDAVLESTVFGMKFPNPVGLSAGFDKNAEVIGPAFKLGFGFVEAGTVTPKPPAGNPKPRVFRDSANNAVINRLGFPNKGAHAFKANLETFLSQSDRPNGVVGLNIGMNKNQKNPATDYAYLIRMLAPMADYLTINISSPNTPGLRNLQKREPLTELLSAVMEERQKACRTMPPPLLVKLAPDLDEQQQYELAQTLMDCKIDGVILSNTTLDRPEFLPEKFRKEQGGLSGQPLTQKSTQIIRNFYKLTHGKLPIIGVGGISNGDQAYEKIKAGASLIQLYTGLVFEGPSVAYSINKRLLELLKADGIQNISEAVGLEHQG